MLTASSIRITWSPTATVAGSDRASALPMKPSRKPKLVGEVVEQQVGGAGVE